MEEFKDNLESQFGDYKAGEENIDGKRKIILTTKNNSRYIMGFLIEKEGINLIAIPEEDAVDIELTQLERGYLETAAHRAAHALGSKFGEKTNSKLSTFTATFERGPGIIILSWDEGEVSITEGELGYSEDK